MINEQLKNIIKKYKIEQTQNIIYGTNIPMPNAVVPTPWKNYIKFEESQFYFFYFDENGIKIYPRDGEGYLEIPWSVIIDFSINHILFIGKMTIKTEYDTYKFQINRFVIGCPWIKANTQHLESVNYFYTK